MCVREIERPGSECATGVGRHFHERPPERSGRSPRFRAGSQGFKWYTSCMEAACRYTISPASMSIEILEATERSVPFAPVEFPPLAVLYKHSPICSISTQALTEVKAFANENDNVPVLMIDVLGQQALSYQLAAQLGIEHESPQVIVVENGKAVWSRSGRRIRLDAIERAVDGVR